MQFNSLKLQTISSQPATSLIIHHQLNRKKSAPAEMRGKVDTLKL